jgi:CheY-like chemotaxis protein
MVYTASRGARRPAGFGEQRVELLPSARRTEPAAQALLEAPEGDAAAPLNEADDDRENIQQGDLVLLIVENDLAFARFLLDTARAKGFKGLVTSMGAGALTLANQFKPSAITLDMYLPDMDGWRVLDRIKQDLGARHIPVCVISTDDSKERAFQSGAIAFVEKPIQSQEVLDAMLDKLHAWLSAGTRHLLIAMNDTPARREFTAHVMDDNVKLVIARPGEPVARLFENQRYDCVVVDEDFPGVDTGVWSQGLLSQASVGPLPVVIHRRGDSGEKFGWQFSESVNARDARSVERMFDLTVLALHVSAARLPEAKRSMISDLQVASKPLAGKRVLIVDDDMRNIFALATVLEEQGMDIVWADNGRDAISKVAKDADIRIVLMDIMMPEMDGMATMKEIRKLPVGKNLPMIAVTAKAMKGDREKCIEAGAWDYLSKPVNTQDLLSVLRAWLHQ